MEINKDILLECISYFYKYKFSDIKDYQIRDGFILATVISEKDKMHYYVGQKNVDIDFDEYFNFLRMKKLNHINKNIKNI